ncbi:hypothetical protein SAMD00019534_009930, partial [Acytostelium subglobosum LB1]|uniref:hypothetical protein n=1 Tax=Acytostelium subglobosum LB1 TaxID=1410327 RepID=UPI0006452392
SEQIVYVGERMKLPFKINKKSLWYTLAPMLGVTIVCFGALNHFMEHKYERWDSRRLGDPNKKSSSLEEEYEKMSKKVDLSHWEAKPVPGSKGYEK